MSYKPEDKTQSNQKGYTPQTGSKPGTGTGSGMPGTDYNKNKSTGFDKSSTNKPFDKSKTTK